MNAYWYEWMFVGGSLVLASGLLLVGLLGTGPARITCLVLLAIITFSLYIGGTAWVGSVVNTVRGVT